MILLKPVSGNVPIIVWRRNSWVSMPHHRATDQLTYCGRDVFLGNGITGIAMTQLDSTTFFSVACGVCCNSLMREMKEALKQNNAAGLEKWQIKLRNLEWKR